MLTSKPKGRTAVKGGEVFPEGGLFPFASYMSYISWGDILTRVEAECKSVLQEKMKLDYA